MDHIVFIHHPSVDTWVASTFVHCEYTALNMGAFFFYTSFMRYNLHTVLVTLKKHTVGNIEMCEDNPRVTYRWIPFPMVE